MVVKTNNKRKRPQRPSEAARAALAMARLRRAVTRRPSSGGRGNAKRRSTISETASAGYLILFLLVMACTVGAFVWHLSVRYEGIRLGYETSRARAERARLLVERRELRLELASLKAPEKIEAMAREKLDMEMPKHDRIVTIGKKRRAVLASGGAH